ncbi:MAG: AI-2E family transporter [Rickettsiaceae bacterium]
MNRAISWLLVLSLISVSIYLVSNILAPFLISLVFAYLLQPIISTICSKLLIPRSIATIIVFALFLVIVSCIIIIVGPKIYHQLAILVRKIPEYKSSFNNIVSTSTNYLHDIDANMATKVDDFARQLINNIVGFFSSFANNLWQATLATINFITILVLVPILLYYFLRDWYTIVGSIESVLPIKGKSTVHKIATSINELLAAYIRGQLNICMILTLYYIIGLSIIGIDLALLLGIFSGFCIIIPFIGVLISFVLVALSCYLSFGAGIELIYVTILFIIGHIIESYFLTPKIIGDKIGLHPVWIIFAVLAAAHLFGIIGIMFAIPIAGIVKVFLKYTLDYYRSTDLYQK